MIKAVIFDMFETLITQFNSPVYFGAHMALDADIPESDFLKLWEPTGEARTTGSLTLEAALEEILRKTDSYSEALLNRLVEKRKAAKRECFRHLHPEILPMLEELKGSGVRVGLISNCFSEEVDVIRNSILHPYFDAEYLSFEQGLQKPDPEIFIRCMACLNVKAEECLYVGDGGSRELEAASVLGMKAIQAVWYLKDGTTQPTGRMAGYAHAESPLDIMKYCRCVHRPQE